MQQLNPKNALAYRSPTHPRNERKARTRTLIQLGGLFEKSGLLGLVGLRAGDDLQQDPHTFDAAATLLGGLLSLKEDLLSDDAEAYQILWRGKGQKAFHHP